MGAVFSIGNAMNKTLQSPANQSLQVPIPQGKDAVLKGNQPKTILPTRVPNWETEFQFRKTGSTNGKMNFPNWESRSEKREARDLKNVKAIQKRKDLFPKEDEHSPNYAKAFSRIHPERIHFNHGWTQRGEAATKSARGHSCPQQPSYWDRLQNRQRQGWRSCCGQECPRAGNFAQPAKTFEMRKGMGPSIALISTSPFPPFTFSVSESVSIGVHP